MAVVLEFRSNAAKVIRDQEKVIEQADKMAKGYKETAKEAGQLERAATRLNKQLEGPQERHNRKLSELSTLLKSGRINQDQMRRAVELYNRQLREAETGGMKAFGPGALANLKTFTLGMAGAAGGAMAVVSAMRTINAQAEEMASKFMERGAEIGGLLELRAGDPEGQQDLINKLRQTLREGTVGDVRGGRDLIFALESASALEERGTFSRLNLATDAASLVTALGKVRGKREDVQLADLADMAIAAAAKTPGASTVDIAETTTSFKKTGQDLGLSDAERFAAAQIVAQTTREPGQAGTQINALLSAVIRQGLAPELKGKGLSAILSTIEQRAPTEQAQLQFLGSTEAFSAFGALQSGQLAKTIGELQEADRRNLAAQLAGDASNVPEIRALIRQRQATFAKEFAFDRGALAEAQWEAHLERGRGTAELAGDPMLVTYIGDAVAQGIKSVIGPENALMLFGEKLDRLNETMTHVEQNQSGRPPVTRVEGRQE
jgi:hypothetical protein